MGWWEPSLDIAYGTLCVFLCNISYNFITNFKNSQEGRIQQCSSDYECEKIAPDADSVGIHTACEDSEYGNDKSPKVCSVLFWAVN